MCLCENMGCKAVASTNGLSNSDLVLWSFARIKKTRHGVSESCCCKLLFSNHVCYIHWSRIYCYLEALILCVLDVHVFPCFQYYYWLITTYYLLPVTYDLLPTACYYPLPTTDRLLPSTTYLLLANYYLLPVTYHLLSTTYYSPATTTIITETTTTA